MYPWMYCNYNLFIEPNSSGFKAPWSRCIISKRMLHPTLSREMDVYITHRWNVYLKTSHFFEFWSLLFLELPKNHLTQEHAIVKHARLTLKQNNHLFSLISSIKFGMGSFQKFHELKSSCSKNVLENDNS